MRQIKRRTEYNPFQSHSNASNAVPGSIVKAHVPWAFGTEGSTYRPCLVLKQNARSAIVLCITSSPQAKRYKFNVPVGPRNGLDHSSVISISSATTIPHGSIQQRLGSISSRTLTTVIKKLREDIGLVDHRKPRGNGSFPRGSVVCVEDGNTTTHGLVITDNSQNVGRNNQRSIIYIGNDVDPAPDSFSMQLDAAPEPKDLGIIAFDQLHQCKTACSTVVASVNNKTMELVNARLDSFFPRSDKKPTKSRR